MSKNQKNGHKNQPTTELIVFVTVILELVRAVIELITKLTE